MRIPLPILLTCCVFGSGTALAADTPADEAKFAEKIAGLTPGEPLECLGSRIANTNRLEAIGSRLIYRVSRSRLYVNQTTGGCQGVRRGDILVTRSIQGRMCRGDVAQTVDYPSQMPSGGCTLGAFVPYTSK